MKKNSTVQPLSENTRKAIIIAAIVVVAVIILSVALALILKPTVLSPDDQQTPGSSSSSLPIRNGDFEYSSSEDTAFPKTAQNWTRYGYKKATGSSHDFESITGTDKAVMGIINVSEDDDDEDNWKTVNDDLKAEGLTVKNPGLHEGIEDGDDENSNIYMIATKEATTASILSDSTSISSGASVKITIWLNTAQLAEGSKAVVMIQKSTVSAKETNWYAYDFEIDQSSEYEKDENGWQKLEFYIFNREASTKYIRVSIGIGNVYSGEKNDNVNFSDYADEPITGSGVLFVDDITYETVTANDYREVVDNDPNEESTMYKIIENEDIVEKSQYFTLSAQNGYEATEYTTSQQYADEANGYSPFTTRDDFEPKGETSGFKIYKMTHNGSEITNSLAMRLNADGTVKGTNGGINIKSSLLLKDHHHISFWVRVDKANEIAYANVYVQRWNREAEGADKWEDLNSGDWKKIVTSQEIDEDTNCGWLKYDIYLKPSAIPEEISILFVFGKKDTYTEKDKSLGLFPSGSMYVTSPAYESISYSDYNSASSGSYVKKLDLVGTSTSTNITNGSFSTLDSSGLQPSGWTQAFGGDNSIFRDGLGNLGGLSAEQRLATTIAGSGTIQRYGNPVKDIYGQILDTDEQQNVLSIVNNEATSFGYYSNNITLYAHTAYVLSAMFRTDEGLNPFIYVIDTDTEKKREERILASVTSTAQQNSGINARLLNHNTDNNQFVDGWARYYMIVVTGDESMTVRLALFNGSIDGETTQQGTVYYDKVEMHTVGTYSFVKADDDEIKENSYYETHYKVDWAKFSHIDKNAGFGENFGELLEKTVSEDDATLLLTSWGIEVYQPDEEAWKEMTVIPPEEEPGDDNPNHGNDTTEPREIDWALLFSVISSVALLAALLVVFVVRVYRSKGRNSRAA